MQPQLEAVKAAERVVRFGERVANHKAAGARREHTERVARAVRILHLRPVAAAVEVQRILRETTCPVHAMGLVNVDTQELRFTDPAVDRSRQQHGMIAEDIRERDGGAAKKPRPKLSRSYPTVGRTT